MTTGEALGVALLSGLSVWGLFDAAVWLLGKETFSRWVITESKKRLIFSLAALTVIVGGAYLLVSHFELAGIILCHLSLGPCSRF